MINFFRRWPAYIDCGAPNDFKGKGMAPKSAADSAEFLDTPQIQIEIEGLSMTEAGVLDALPAGIALLDPDGTIGYVNRA